MNIKQARKVLSVATYLFLFCVALGVFLPFEGEAAVRVGVVTFVEKSGMPQIYITDIFTRILSDSKAIEVIGREQMEELGRAHNIKTSSMVDARTATEAGRLAGCRYILLGAITERGQTYATNTDTDVASSFLGSTKISINSQTQVDATLTLDIRIIDVSTGEVVLSLAKTGNARQYYSQDYELSSRPSKPSKEELEEEQKRQLREGKEVGDRLIKSAASQVAEKVREALVGEYACVSGVEGKSLLRINRGSAAGVLRDNLYRVYAEGEELLDVDGSLLGKDVFELAVVRVKNVRDEESIAEVENGSLDVVRQWDRIELISEKEAEGLAQQNAFPKDRPSGALPQSPTATPRLAKLGNKSNIRPTTVGSPVNKAKQASSVATNLPQPDATTITTMKRPGNPAPKNISQGIRLGIMRFESKAEEVSERQAGAITDIFTRMLSNSKSISVLERERLDMIAREHKLNISGLVDPNLAVQVGKLAGCQYILLGSVTELSEKETRQGREVRRDEQEAIATIDARIVDVATSQITMTFSGVGSASQTSTSHYRKTGGWINPIYIPVGVEIERGGIKSQAIIAATSQLGHKVRERLGREYAHVADVSGKYITIDQGANFGVLPGDFYSVFSGASDSDSHVVAVIRVVDVKEGSKFSTARMIEDGGGDLDMIQRGARLEAITQSRAQDIINRKAFRKAEATDRKTDSQLIGSIMPGSSSNSRREFENSSTDPKKVIASYGLSEREISRLTEEHIKASKMRSPEKMFERYEELFRDNPQDFLAAYCAGEISFNIGKRGRAQEWLDKALAINPRYYPAKNLRKKIK